MSKYIKNVILTTKLTILAKMSTNLVLMIKPQYIL